MKLARQIESPWSGWLRSASVLASALILTVVLWGLQERSLRSRLHLETAVTAEQSARRLSDWMADRMNLSAFLAEDWVSESAEAPGRFKEDAQRFVDHFSGFQTINWIDPAGTIRIVVPAEGNASALNVNLHAHPSPYVREALERALREKRLTRTPAIIDLLQGGKGFATYRPIFSRDGRHLGYINSVFRVDELLHTCLRRLQVNQRFQFAIQESEGEIVYPAGAAPEFPTGSQSAVELVDVADLPWKLYLSPTPEYLGQQRFAAHHLILPVGLLVALLLAGFDRSLVNRNRALQSTQAQYQALFEEAPIAYFSVRPDLTVERANHAAGSMTGLLDGELIDSSFYDLLPEVTEIRSRARLLLEAVYRDDPIRTQELSMLRAGGGVFRAVLYVDGEYAADGAFSGYRIAVVDVTDRHEAEEARVRLSAAIDQSEECVVITGPTGEVLYVNPSAGATSEWCAENYSGRSLEDFLRAEGAAPGDVANVTAAIRARASWRGTCPLYRGDAGKLQMVSTLSPVRDGDGSVINFVFSQRDISHEVDLQTQLQQAHKLEAVGRLAGGIAHDFNNILQSLLGYAALARRNPANQEDVALCLDEIERAGHRAANLVSHILAFGRQTAVEKKSLAVKPVIEEVAALVRGSLPDGIRLELSFSDIQYPVSADSTQIHQVLMNLASNAVHALRDGGTLTLRYEAVQLAEAEAARWPALKPGPCMRLIVSDDGIGMEAGTLERIFEPYFSTRETGTGTGLGLATVHGIVEHHGGAIYAESTPGCGSRFTILLPASPVAALTSPGREERETGREMEEGPRQSDTKTHVLYVDDEGQIVDSMRRILERFGFEVTGFTSSRAALESLRRDPAAFDLLVTDLTMPDINGLELASEASTIRPGLPVILCSGYSDSFEKAIGESSHLVRTFLKKPVSARDLAAEIKRLAASDSANG